MSSTAAPLVATRSRAADFVTLLKLRLNVLVLLAAAAGWFLAAPADTPLVPLLAFLAGVLLAGGGASAMNMGIEGELDRLMERTRTRPVAAGRIAREEAVVFGAFVAASGIALVAIASTLVAAALTATTVLLYVLAYTPLKTRTPLNTVVGAIPGALPPLIGWTAASGGALPLPALSLFGIVFLWQFPHFLAIASMYREDYARGGFKMLPVVDPLGFRTAHRVVVYALVLLPVSVLPSVAGVCGPIGFAGAFTFALAYLVFAVRAAALRTDGAWKDLLRASLVVLPGIFLFLMIDRWIG
jgi:protoheme IX farnesyltransferase